MEDKNALRNLKIKTGVVQRTVKELHSYEKELKDNIAKIDEIRRGTDHSMLKQWEQVREETKAMIPNTSSRLSLAVDDLQGLVTQITSMEKLKNHSDVQTANAAISAARTALE